MEVRSEKVIIEASGELASAADATVDHQLALTFQLPVGNATVIGALSTATGVAGQLYYDSTNDRIMYQQGQAWVALATSGA